MATTKLDLYNKALRIIGERRLASLTEERKVRRSLDDVWDQGGVNACIERAQWHFAMRSVLLDYDPSIEPSFGYRRAFQKPSDWVVTSSICYDEFFNSPITAYVDEAGYIYCELDIIYVRYGSNDASYGNDMLKWPESFENYVAAYFAAEIYLDITSAPAAFARVEQIAKDRLKIAKNLSAMTEGTKFPATGSWVKARENRGSGERGNRHSLYG
jgi:hypothetical protein